MFATQNSTTIFKNKNKRVEKNALSGKPVLGTDTGQQQTNKRCGKNIQSFNWLRKQKHKTSV